MTAPRFRVKSSQGCKTVNKCDITKPVYTNRTSADRIRKRVAAEECKVVCKETEQEITQTK